MEFYWQQGGYSKLGPPHRTPRIGVTAEQDLRRVQGEGGGTRLLPVAQIRADLDGCRSEAGFRVSPVRIGLLDNSLKIRERPPPRARRRKTSGSYGAGSW